MMLLAVAALLLAPATRRATLCDDETAVCPAGQFGLKADDGTVTCTACPILSFKAADGACLPAAAALLPANSLPRWHLQEQRQHHLL